MPSTTILGKKEAARRTRRELEARALLFEEAGLDAKSAWLLSTRFTLALDTQAIVPAQDITTVDAARRYLTPTEHEALPTPNSLKGMFEATGLLADAIRQGKKITVYGDYDADGNTSSAIIANTIRDYTGALADHYIPWRKEGYGLSKHAIDSLHERGTQTLVVVDCGTTSHQEVAYAQSLGMEVLVIDHHLPRTNDPLPPCPMVNPSQPGETYPHKKLCAAGLAYIFSRDLQQRLKQEDCYPLANRRDKGPLLVAAAIGTITDVMTLDNPVNRYLVQAGLTEINSRRYPGINALMDIYGLKTVRETDIAFLLGPIFNAAGRMGKPDLGMELLTEQDPQRAMALAKELKHANEERKILTESTAAQAFAKAEAYLKTHPRPAFLMVEDERWDKGIVGIVASRLKERYNLPVAIGAVQKDKAGSGKITYSVRSIPGVDFFHGALEPLLAREESGLLTGGGHAMAAGMSLRLEDRDSVQQTINTALDPAVKDARRRDRLHSDGAATLEEFQTPEFFEKLYRALYPMGAGMAPPRFWLHNVQVKRINQMGPQGQDLDVTLGYPGRDDILLEHGAAFRHGRTPLGKTLTSPTRYREALDVLVEPYLFENETGKLTIGYHVVDSSKPRLLEMPELPASSKLATLEAQRQTPQQATTALRSVELFDIADADPEKAAEKRNRLKHDPAAQQALKTLYEHHICVFDTETTGRKAGKNAISQLGAIKVGYHAEENYYYPIIRNWHATPHKPEYFAYETLRPQVQGLRYNAHENEYVSDPTSEDVTHTTYARENPLGDINGMQIADKTVSDARPFYRLAPDILDFMGDCIPVAYNMPFDAPMTLLQLIASAGHPDFSKNRYLSKNPDALAATAARYEAEIAAPLRAKMAQHSPFIQTLNNPAQWHCAMYGSFVHRGIFQMNRITHTAERAGISFSRDEQKHDAVEDSLPLIYLYADQIAHFGSAQDMRGLWEKELQKIHPAFRVEETAFSERTKKTIPLSVFPPGMTLMKDHEILLDNGQFATITKVTERGVTVSYHQDVPGQLRISYPPEQKNDPSIRKVMAYLQSFAQVERYNSKAKGSRLVMHTFEDDAHSITLLNKTKNANNRTNWLSMMKTFIKWSVSTGQQAGHASAEAATIYPHFDYRCFDYSSRGDFTLTHADGSAETIEGVPLSSFRRSEDFICRPDQRQHMADYLKALRLLDTWDFSGIASLTETGLEIRGVQRDFGDATVALPADISLAEFLELHKAQLKDILKISGIPMVHGTYMETDALKDEDKRGDDDAEEFDKAKRSALRLRSHVHFTPNPHVEMDISASLLSVVGLHMNPPHRFTMGETHLSGLHCEALAESGVVRLRGKLEAFKEVGQELRNAAWLVYRLQTLPSVRPSLTKLDEQSETLTLYCSPAPRAEDLWILDEAHVPCHVYKDRIEINLRPLLNDPYHWYKMVTKELREVKQNRKRKDRLPEPERLKDVVKALAEDRVTAYHTDRNHHAWIDFASMRNVPLDPHGGTLLDWPVSRLQSNIAFPQTLKDVSAACPPNIAHLLCDSVGHSQPRPAMFRELSDGTIDIRVPDYPTLGDSFPQMSERYRGLGKASVSAHINPLLDAMRNVAENPDMRIPNATMPADKAARMQALYTQFRALTPMLADMGVEAKGILKHFRTLKSPEGTYEELAVFDHLYRELEKYARAYPGNEKIQHHLRMVEQYYDRVSLAEFKKYETQKDLSADKSAREGLEEEGRYGAIPTLNKALHYLKPEQQPGFHETDPYRQHDAYLKMKRAFFNAWRAGKKLHRTLLFSHEITATGMLLNDQAEASALRSAADFVQGQTRKQLELRLRYWERRGLITNIAYTVDGIQFKPSEYFLKNPHAAAAQLLQLPEHTPHDLATQAQGFPLVLSHRALRQLHRAALPFDRAQNVTLLPLAYLWMQEGKGPVIFTDVTLQCLFKSPLPLRPEDLIHKNRDGSWGEPIYPAWLSHNPHTQALLEMLRHALQSGAQCYVTPAGDRQLQRFYRYEPLQHKWAAAFPDAPPVAQLSFSEIRNYLLKQPLNPAQKQFVRTVQQMLQPASYETAAISHAMLRLNQDQPHHLPVLLYKGKNPSSDLAEISSYTGMPDALNYGTMSTASLVRQTMLQAKASGAFLLHPQELQLPKLYPGFTRAKTSLHLVHPPEIMPAFPLARMIDMVPAQRWRALFTQRLDQLNALALDEYTTLHSQVVPIWQAKARLHPETPEVDGHSVSRFVHQVVAAPEHAAARLRALPPETQQQLLQQMEQHAPSLLHKGKSWETRLDNVQQLMALNDKTESDPVAQANACLNSFKARLRADQQPAQGHRGKSPRP